MAESRADILQSITVTKLQKHQKSIHLCDYQDNWVNLYQREEKRILETLKDKVIRLEHVGSTSVPGLCAKPIIDILLIVEDSSDEKDYVPLLESVGYTLKIREPDWNEHRMCKGPDTDINLHIFSNGCEEADRMIQLRDWLRQHDEDRLLYATTKQVLSKQVWEYIQDYADAKSEVVQDIMKRAIKK